MADNQEQQQAQPAEKKEEKKKLTIDAIAEEWSKQIAIPTATAAVMGAGLYYGSQIASSIPKSFGLEGAVSGAFGSLGNIGVGAATFGLLTLGLPLLYYPASHILNGGKAEDVWNDLKKNYFKHPIEKMALNTIPSLAAMDAASGYTWTSYLASGAMPYATSLSSLLAPYLAVSPAILLGIGAGLGVLGLIACYSLAFSRGEINYKKLALSPIAGPYHLAVGIVKTAYEAIKGVVYRGLSILDNARVGIHDLGFSTQLAMLGVVPAPAGKKK